MNLLLLATSGDHLTWPDAIALVAMCIMFAIIIWAMLR